MITLLIGHRGVGKTSLLARLPAYREGARTWDLDTEINRRTGRSVDEIFRADGEAAFRRLEESTLAELVAEIPPDTEAWIALGAGYEGRLPAGSRVLWIRRATDADGRIFLDRPRLSAKLRPLEEFAERFANREERYRKLAHADLFLREGVVRPDAAEALYFGDPLKLAARLKSATNLVFTHLPATDRLREWSAWGARIEVRSDHWEAASAAERARELPDAKWLWSLRPTTDAKLANWLRFLSDEAPLGEAWIDCDIALATGRESLLRDLETRGAELFFSAHRESAPTREEAERRLADLATKFPRSRQKLAWPTNSLAELHRGHEWALAEASRRVFLPMSADGRWSWYRLAKGAHAPMCFVREGEGSAKDQPTLLDFLAQSQSATEGFAAVLGSPVHHSRSPVFHEKYAAARGWSFHALRLEPEDFTTESLRILTRLGLRAAAVTAPLKEIAFELASERDLAAQRFRSANTLAFRMTDGAWVATNTDFEGLAFAVRNVDFGSNETAVWGGGGTREVLRELLPRATFYSARTGEKVSGVGAASPRYLVWAAGNKGGDWPHEAWRPKRVFDLDYRENSLGREYAMRVGAAYHGGSAMFKRQAEIQQRFWSKF